MGEHISFKRKALGRYQVLFDGILIGEVHTTCQNEHWSWVVVGEPGDRKWRKRHFRSRDDAALAAAEARVS